MITGVERVLTFLRNEQKKAERNQVTYVVGFNANYAIYVHEDMLDRPLV